MMAIYTKKNNCIFLHLLQGDGGDALVLKNGTSWELIGVALDIAEFECGKSRQPAMFTSVAHYLEWIATYGPGCLCHKG